MISLHTVVKTKIYSLERLLTHTEGYCYSFTTLLYNQIVHHITVYSHQAKISSQDIHQLFTFSFSCVTLATAICGCITCGTFGLTLIALRGGRSCWRLCGYLGWVLSYNRRSSWRFRRLKCRKDTLAFRGRR